METTRSSGVLRVLREALGKRANASEEEGAESGFTLIELMVVLLIMAILLAIAIPTFLGVQGGAQDRAAQSNLTTAFTSAKAYYANNGSTYTPSTGTSLISELTVQEPELTFTTGSVTKAALNGISVDLGTGGNSIIMADQSASGICWALGSYSGSGTSSLGVPVGQYYTASPVAASCVATTYNTGMTKGGSGNGHWSQTYPAGP